MASKFVSFYQPGMAFEVISAIVGLTTTFSFLDRHKLLHTSEGEVGQMGLADMGKVIYEKVSRQLLTKSRSTHYCTARHGAPHDHH
jgi:hypothetical protein